MVKKKSIRTIALFLCIVILIISSGCSKSGGDSGRDELKLCSHPLREYKIVTGEESEYAEFSAEIFARYISRELGYTLETVSNMPEKGFAVLLCDNGDSGDNSEFTVEKLDGDNIQITGSGISVAAGLGYLAHLLEESANGDKNAVVTGSETYPVEYSEPDSVILFIGDGMGENHISMTVSDNPTVTGEDGEAYTPTEKPLESFAALSLPNKGEAVTVNCQGMITDSAASATALATGYKTMNGVLGMVPADLDLDGEDNELRSVANVREAAALKGMKNAVLSTDRETGATPNAFLVHHNDRYDSSVVLEQQKSIEETEIGCDKVWCSYDSDDFFDEFKSTLLDFSSSDNGFFIMAEEAMTDKFASKLDYDNVIRTVKRFDKLIKFASCYASFSGDVSIIVTADHETGGLTEENGEFFWTSGGEHTDRNVGVYAMGGGTEVFADTTVDNTNIASFIFDVIENREN